MKLRRQLIVFQPARRGTRNGKPYRYWNSGRGVFAGLTRIEQHGRRFQAFEMLHGLLGIFATWDVAADAIERAIRGSAKAMGLPSPEEIEAIDAKRKQRRKVKR